MHLKTRASMYNLISYIIRTHYKKKRDTWHLCKTLVKVLKSL